MKDHWIFLGSEVPQGVHPEVDGQRCYVFRTGRGPDWRRKLRVIPVAKFVDNLWGKGIEL